MNTEFSFEADVPVVPPVGSPPEVVEALDQRNLPPYICIHEPFEPEPGWCIISIPGRGIFIRVCRKCRIVYADLKFPSLSAENT